MDRKKKNIEVTIVFLCRLYVNWRFLRGIEAQFLALQKGFNEVIPQHLLKTFDEKELEVSLLIINVFLLHACVCERERACGNFSSFLMHFQQKTCRGIDYADSQINTREAQSCAL